MWFWLKPIFYSVFLPPAKAGGNSKKNQFLNNQFQTQPTVSTVGNVFKIHAKYEAKHCVPMVETIGYVLQIFCLISFENDIFSFYVLREGQKLATEVARIARQPFGKRAYKRKVNLPFYQDGGTSRLILKKNHHQPPKNWHSFYPKRSIIFRAIGIGKSNKQHQHHNHYQVYNGVMNIKCGNKNL